MGLTSQCHSLLQMLRCLRYQTVSDVTTPRTRGGIMAKCLRLSGPMLPEVLEKFSGIIHSDNV